MKLQLVRKILPGLLFLVLIAAAFFFWDRDAFIAWKADLNPWAFFLLMTIAPAFGVPTSPFYLVAGLSFGPILGLGGSALAIVGNLLLVYAIGRSGLRPTVDRLLQGRKFQLPTESPTHPIRYTILVKIAPAVPAFLKNYLLVLSHIPFLVYLVVSFLFSFLYAVIFNLLGDSIEDREPTRGISILALLIALTVLIWYLNRRSKAAQR